MKRIKLLIYKFFYLGVKEDVSVSITQEIETVSKWNSLVVYYKQTAKVKWFYLFGLPLFVVDEEKIKEIYEPE